MLQFCQVDSTNRVLRHWIQRGSISEGTIVVSTRQTNGKGQQGRTWLSPGGGVYLSLALFPETSPEMLTALTLMLAWGVVDRLRHALSSSLIQLKWPNDIVIQGQKLAGILLQSSSQDTRVQAVVAGIGMNVNNPVPETGISLKQFTGSELDLTQVAVWILEGLEKGYFIWKKEGFLTVRSQYEDWMTHRNTWISDPNSSEDVGPICILGVAQSGALQVKTLEGIHERSPGELRLGYSQTVVVY
jgi:BirA family biotin operon repressor/biotin-[acetyl-CoA-carboxylase] ligase